MIEVKKLYKRYDGGEALCGVDLKVNVGEVCAVAGKEGSGRTTLTDLVSGCIEPDKGQILICGIDMMERPSEAKQHMGYAPAVPALYGDMSPRAGMKFIADARSFSAREAAEMIDNTIRRFKIKEIADTPASGLSVGSRRLASLAQAAFAGGEAIVIDEPTAGLNPKEILEVRRVIADLKKDHAVLVTSQSLTEICELADRVIMLHEGKAVAEGAPDQLHRMTMKDGTLLLTVRGEESSVKAAMDSVKGAQSADVTAAGNGEFSCVLHAGQKGADLREAAFRAVCEKGLVLLGMTPGAKPLDELLSELTSEPFAFAPEKEEQADEGDI